MQQVAEHGRRQSNNGNNLSFWKTRSSYAGMPYHIFKILVGPVAQVGVRAATTDM